MINNQDLLSEFGSSSSNSFYSPSACANNILYRYKYSSPPISADLSKELTLSLLFLTIFSIDVLALCAGSERDLLLIFIRSLIASINSSSSNEKSPSVSIWVIYLFVLKSLVILVSYFLILDITSPSIDCIL